MSHIPTEQKSLFIQATQGAWQVAPSDVPVPGPGEILVRVEATALNPIDWKIHAFGMAISVNSFPAVLGTDSAGVVVKIGEGVTRVEVGDRVLHQGAFTNNRTATFQQYTIIHADLVAKIPSGLSFDQAASVPVSLGAAAISLYGDKVPKGGVGLIAPWREGGRDAYTGQPIVILGGTSSVGQYAIQLAKHSGFSPIITTTSPENNALVTSLGATHTLDKSLPRLTLLSTISSITSTPIKFAFDAVSIPDTQQIAYDSLAPGGTLILLLDDKVENKIEGDGKVIARTFGSVHMPWNRRFGVELYANLEKLLESGDIRPWNVERVPGGLASVPDALERMKQGRVSAKKLVVLPPETV